MKRFLLVAGLLLLFGPEILRVYLIMPFPGSQHRNTVLAAYWISRHIVWLRLLGAALLMVPIYDIFSHGRKRTKILFSLIAVLYATIFLLFNYKFEADKMFYQPKQKTFAFAPSDTTDKNKLVIGVSIAGEAKAYPIQIIGYHHQVVDVIGHTTVMITYCTVCRTGRVFSPMVNGQRESFRLVGMDHFNAMFEDATTKSWWQQATGMAVAGPLAGTFLRELPSAQMSLEAWLHEHPSSAILQPDSSFKKRYKDLAGYDKGTIDSHLEKRDSLSWQPKSWVVGVAIGAEAKAYDWNHLVKQQVINDSLNGLPVVLTLEEDTVSFHVFDRRVSGVTLNFDKTGPGVMVDQNTHSTWNAQGNCSDGTMKGTQLTSLQSYQEFWHSWSTFHSGTSRFPG